MSTSIDFTSSLYLGLRHPTGSLQPWASLTSGVPAALRELGESKRVARDLATLVGCEDATLGVSTLHLFLDWFGTRARAMGSVVLWDDGTYPIARWGIELACARGARAGSFRHFDASSLAERVRRVSARGLTPIVVTDGYCPGCARMAPLHSYLELTERASGTLVVDDSQAIGLLGAGEGSPESGGGSLARGGLASGRVIWIASLAKAFGAPLASLAGTRTEVERFERSSVMRVHCSPPSAAAVAAAARALARNRACGALLRGRLGARIRQFRAGLSTAGLEACGGAHPVQLLAPIAGVSPRALHAALANRGVQTVLVRPQCRERTAIAWLINATHEQGQIDRALNSLTGIVARLRDRGAPDGAEGRL